MLCRKLTSQIKDKLEGMFLQYISKFLGELIIIFEISKKGCCNLLYSLAMLGTAKA